MSGRAACAVALGVLAACQGQGRDPAREPARDPARQAGSAAGPAVPGVKGAPARPEDARGGAAPGPSSEARTIARLGAVPAWEGVVQRGQLLARRGQRGTLVGRVGPAVGEGNLVWLVDDTEGDGCLAVRAAFPGAAPAAGARVAATGAWALVPGDEPASASGTAAAAAPAAPHPSRWVWQVEATIGLSQGEEVRPSEVAAGTDAAEGEGEAPQAGDASAIGHEPAVRPRPPGAVLISKAKDNDLVIFVVLSAARGPGEGILIGDQLGSPVIATLYLPGDRPSYGGIDFRQPDEVWRLRRGGTYVVRIGKIRRKDPAKPAQINARGAPIKVS